MLKVVAQTSSQHSDIVKWLGEVHSLRYICTETLTSDHVAVWMYTLEWMCTRKEVEDAVKALNRLKGTSARIFWVCV